MPSIRLNCFLRSGTVNNIFDVEIDNNLTIDNLKNKIKDTRQDLRQVNFDLYEVNFFQPNPFIVSSVNSFTASQEVFMDPQRKILIIFPPCISILS
ncbi:hypothetical protein C1646_726870 [Rhizophagus diaphanus]|nr:hypothetical protein C1646_726870 [Rhizophagus diaphanus] [Rhizophagus sp. MUCL 43196]